MQGHIEIGTIPHDLRQEETVIQIAKVLDTLNSAVSNIFGCIDERLSANTKRLAGIKNRAVRVQGRLDHLQNNLNLKAIKLYSAAKYPSNHVYKEYPVAVKMTIKQDNEPEILYKSPVPIAQERKSSGIVRDKIKNGQRNGDANIQEKLQFYHIKSTSKERKNTEISRMVNVRQTSVSSLLLDDGKGNQYGKIPDKILVPANDKREIGDAPTSILQSWHPTDQESPSNYFYAPTLGEVPQINVPLTLPDLPGIVDDERFVLDLNGQSPIAPSSVVTTPTVNLNLPETHTETPANDLSIPNLSLPNLVPEQHPPPSLPSVQTDTSSQPIIPPPPPPPVPVTVSSQQPPPPPPPLPQPSIKESSLKDEIKKEHVRAAPKTESVDDRSNLMAAIRNAGGIGRAKLKSAAREVENAEKWSSASVGGDLMADLHTKLSLRRKGISGTVTGALDRMSAMIPPPPKPNDSVTSERNSAASEQDSQPDTDDWEE